MTHHITFTLSNGEYFKLSNGESLTPIVKSGNFAGQLDKVVIDLENIDETFAAISTVLCCSEFILLSNDDYKLYRTSEIVSVRER